MGEKCYVNIKTKITEAEFIGVFQKSEVIDPSPLRGGHSGGVSAYPVAVVKVGTELKEVRITSVYFNI
ncbi:MAG: hypothetical protein ACQEV7_07560 [Bacillota bacterium]